jgi:hypothetical protein
MHEHVNGMVHDWGDMDYNRSVGGIAERVDLTREVWPALDMRLAF